MQYFTADVTIAATKLQKFTFLDIQKENKFSNLNSWNNESIGFL